MDINSISYPIIGTGNKTLSKIKDGSMALSLNLSNDSHVVPSYIDENNIEQSNYNGAETYVVLQIGNKTINPTDLTYTVEKNLVEGDWNPAIAKFTVTKMLDNSGYVDFKTMYKGEEYTSRFSLSKVFNGDDSYIFDIGNNNHTFSSNADGVISQEMIVDIDILVYKGLNRIQPDRIIVPENHPGMTLTVKENLVQMKVLTGSDLAIAGWFNIKVNVHGKTLTKEFRWIKVRDGEKGDQGPAGPPGQDGEQGPPGPQGPGSDIPSWVIDWTNGQTVVNDKLVLAGSIFAGEGGSTATGVALGNKVFTDGSNGLCVVDRGDEVFSIFTKPRTVNGHSYTMVKIGKNDPITIDWSGNVRVPSMSVTGTFSADKISGGTIDANYVNVKNLKVDNISSYSVDPILRLFSSPAGAGYCAIDATRYNESGGMGTSIRLKWDSRNYVQIGHDTNTGSSDPKLPFYNIYMGDGHVDDSNTRMSLTYDNFYVLRPAGSSNFKMELNSSMVKFNVAQGYIDGYRIFTKGYPPHWNDLSGKPSSFSPSSHNHSRETLYPNKIEAYDLVAANTMWSDLYHYRRSGGWNNSYGAGFQCHIVPNTGSRYVGSASYRWEGTFLKSNPNVSSDRNLKENIEYIEDNNRLRYSNSEVLTSYDFHSFLRDDFKIATYNYKISPSVLELDVEEQEMIANMSHNQIGFIAQDIVNTKVGSKIITQDPNGLLSYETGNYTTVIAGALQEEIRLRDGQIEELKNQLKLLEEKINQIAFGK